MNEKPKVGRKKGWGGWLFLAIVLLIYAMTAVLDRELATTAMASFNHLLEKVVPVLVVVLILIFIINLLLTPVWVKKYLGSHSGLYGWLAAIIGGVLSTGPVYPWYALLKDLREQGMKTTLAAVFLYSRAIKLPMLPMLVHYFGITYALVLIIYMLVFSVMSGLLMGRIQAESTITD
ncbi:MAG: hypothetical protein PVF28_05025 [Thioalkalispiraceae bacterium]|jgi:uncharacterized membrane protein YraQ (UPF0718 family)